MIFSYKIDDILYSIEINLDTLEGCPGCGHVPTENEIEDEFIVPFNRDKTLWYASCTEGGGGGCGWEVLADSPNAALTIWNKRTKTNRIKTHECKASITCCCYQLAPEPSEDCPIHGHPHPPRCELCGQFMRWEC